MLTHASEIHSLGGVAAFWRGASTTVIRLITSPAAPGCYLAPLSAAECD